MATPTATATTLHGNPTTCHGNPHGTPMSTVPRLGLGPLIRTMPPAPHGVSTTHALSCPLTTGVVSSGPLPPYHSWLHRHKCGGWILFGFFVAVQPQCVRRVQAWMPLPPRGLIIVVIVVALEYRGGERMRSVARSSERRTECSKSPHEHTVKFIVTPAKVCATLTQVVTVAGGTIQTNTLPGSSQQ